MSASQTKINVKLYPELCPGKNQGFFHTHPKKLSYEKQIGRKLTKEDIKNMAITDERGEISTILTPSQQSVIQRAQCVQQQT